MSRPRLFAAGEPELHQEARSRRHQRACARSHAADDAALGEDSLVVLARVGGPLVRVVEQADLGTAPLDGHLERGDGEVAVVHRRQRPADDELRIQVEDDSEEELAIAGEQLRRVAHPLLVRGGRLEVRFRTVPIVSPAQQSLLAYALEHAKGTDDALFQPWGNVRRDLADACEEAKIERCSPNDLRRTFASCRSRRACRSSRSRRRWDTRTPGCWSGSTAGRRPSSWATLMARAKASRPPHPGPLPPLAREGEGGSSASKAAKPRRLCSPRGLKTSDELECLDPESNQGHGDFQS